MFNFNNSNTATLLCLDYLLFVKTLIILNELMEITIPFILVLFNIIIRLFIYLILNFEKFPKYLFG